MNDLLSKIEAEELKQRALKLNLCPVCGEPLKVYNRHITNESKPTDKYKLSEGYDGWYATKECSKDKNHLFEENYDQDEDDVEWD